jgi:hypothetical protein
MMVGRIVVLSTLIEVLFAREASLFRVIELIVLELLSFMLVPVFLQVIHFGCSSLQM